MDVRRLPLTGQFTNPMKKRVGYVHRAVFVWRRDTAPFSLILSPRLNILFPPE